MRKKFVPAWQPASLIEGHDRWYICFYCVNDLTGERQRFRPTFDLNRITNLQQRRQIGEELCQKLNWWMSQGKPISQFDTHKIRIVEDSGANRLGSTLFVDAMTALLKVLEKTMSADTMRTYRNIGLAFLDYLKRMKMAKLRCCELARFHATGYLDDCLIKRGLAARTYNNQIGHLRTLLNKLMQRGYLSENPFEKLPMLRAVRKNRRNFTAEEARTVASYIREHDRLLFYALILEYACYIRPNEIRKLRFRDVNLEAGIVHVRAENAKNHQDRYPTIPAEFMPLLDAEFFEQYPPTWFIFGKDFKPHDSKLCGRSTMYQKHLLMLERLKATGQLQDINGLTWYSWKDTGITDALEDLPLMAVKDQAGHSDPAMTMRYYHKARENKNMRRMKNKLV